MFYLLLICYYFLLFLLLFYSPMYIFTKIYLIKSTVIYSIFIVSKFLLTATYCPWTDCSLNMLLKKFTPSINLV